MGRVKTKRINGKKYYFLYQTLSLKRANNKLKRYKNDKIFKYAKIWNKKRELYEVYYTER